MNEYDAIYDSVQERQKTALRSSMLGARDSNPDEFAKARSLGQATGVPTDVAARNLPQVQRMADVNEYDALFDKSPALAGKLMKPDFAKLAHDDLEPLTYMERITQAFGRGLVSTQQGADVQGIQESSEILNLIGKIESNDPDVERALALSPYGGMFAGVGRNPENVAALKAGAIERRTKNVLEYGRRTGELKSVRPSPELQAFNEADGIGGALKALSENPLEIIGQLTSQSIGGLLPSLPFIAGGGLAGGVRGVALATGTTSAATEYVNALNGVFQELGVDPTDTAAVEAAIQTPEFKERSAQAFEKAAVIGAFDAATAGVGGVRLARGAATNLAAQTAVQSAGGAAGEAAGSAASGQEINASAVIAEAIGEAPTAVIDASVMAGRKVVESRSRVAKAQADSQVLNDLTEGAKKSKLRERSAEDFKAFVERAAANGPVQDIYVAGEDLSRSLQQSGITPQALAQISPEIASQLPEAATGGMVRIPIGEYAAKIAATDLGQSLLPHLKTEPDGLSLAEAETFQQEETQTFQIDAERAFTETQQAAAAEQSVNAVQAHFEQQIGQTGRFAPEVTKAYGSLMTSFYTTQAERLGMTPDQLLQRYPLVVRGEPTASGLQQSVLYQEATPLALEFEPIAEGSREQTLGEPLAGLGATPDSQSIGVTGSSSAQVAGPSGLPAANETLNQADGSRAAYDPKSGNIFLFEQADLSSLLHEGAHRYLDILADMASAPDAPKPIVDDMAALLSWFGVPDLQTWLSMTLDQKRPSHEKFARGFEARLFEGTSPSLELAGIFRRFRAWLVNIYKSIAALDVQITDEVRAVMDRLIASDVQIAEAKAARAYEPLFKTAADAQMTPEQFAEYQAQFAQVTEEATDKLSERSARDMKWLSNAKSRALKALQKEANEKRKAVREEMTAAVRAEPIYAALRFLKRGEIMVDGEEIAAQVGHKLAIPALEQLYANTNGAPDWRKLTTALGREGLPPDVVADMFGFQSGDQMIRALVEAPKEADEITRRTDKAMLERFGDITSPVALADAANEAITNQARIRFVATELAAVSGMVGRIRDLIRAAKGVAERIIGSKKVRDVRPRQYIGSETKAAKSAEKALAKGDRKEAARFKRQQLLQVTMLRESMNAKEEIDKALTRFRKMFAGKDEDVAKRRDMTLVNAARAILGNHAIGPQSEKAVDYLRNVERYDPALFAVLQPAIDRSLRGGDYRDLSVDEFRGMRDAVASLWEMSLRSKQVEIDGKKMDKDAAVAELLAELEPLGGKVDENRTSTDRDRKVLGLMGWKAALRRVESFADLIGPKFKALIYQPISDGAVKYRAEKLVRMKQYLAELEKIAPGLTYEPIVAPELGDFVFSGGKPEILHALLHTGNESNFKKLVVGNGWGTLDENGALDASRWTAFRDRMFAEGKITKADMAFVQAVWDLFEDMKPQTQAAFKDMYGRYFDEITANPVVTPVGTFRGGYVPAKTDPNRVQEGQRAEDSVLQSANDMYAFPTAGTGATKSRVENYAKPLDLNLKALASHIDWSMRFAHIQPRVLDVYRLLKSRDLAARLNSYAPAVLEETLIPWLQRTAMQQTEKPFQGKGGKLAQKALQTIRRNSSMQLMAINLVNAVQNFSALPVLMLKVPKGKVMAAAIQVTHSPRKTAAEIAEKSEFMRTRQDVQIYDIQRTVDEITLNPSKIEKFRDWAALHGHFMSTATQNMMDSIAWTGAYNAAIERGATEAEAVRESDSIVRLTQGSLAAEDVSAFESGNAFLRLFTMFAGYFNTQANLVGTEFSRATRDAGLRKGAGKLLYVYTLGVMLPAVLGEVIAQGLRAQTELDSDGDDEPDLVGALSFFVTAQLKYVSAFVPILGSAAMSMLNAFNSKPYDDKIASSPAISAVEAAVRVPQDVYKVIFEDKEIGRREIRDVMTLLGLLTGTPAGALARPLGYAVDVQRGEVEPANEADYVRGLVTGAASR